jgi:hypothetical protein
MNDERTEAIASGLEALGSAYRLDWSQCDGRTLMSQLDSYARYLRNDAPITYEDLCLRDGVCPVERCWYEHCSQANGYEPCAHVDRGVSAEAAEETQSQ